MNEKVEKYLEEKREEEKREILIAAGLYEKGYAPKSQELPNREYPFLDSKIIPNRPYKAIPIEVTDEEYEQIRKYAYSGNSNRIAGILTFVACAAYVIGLVIGFILLSGSSNWTTAVYCWAASGISGTIFLGFAEIIKLLQAIKDKK